MHKPKHAQKPTINAGSILKQFQYNPQIPEQDLAACVRIGRNLTLKEQDRAVAIIQHQRLVSWLMNPTPDIVLVNSNGENKRLSPMSYVCAQLITSFGASNSLILPIYFFYSEHVHWRRDRNAYPSSLVSSLIGQLLSQGYPSQLQRIEDLKAKLELSSTMELYDVLTSLITQIPETAIVICIINGISYFEDAERREDMYTVVKCLNSLVNRGKGPLLKVLLGSPSSCRYLLRYVSKDDTVNIPALYPSQGGFRRMQFNQLAQLAEKKRPAGGEED